MQKRAAIVSLNISDTCIAAIFRVYRKKGTYRCIGIFYYSTRSRNTVMSRVFICQVYINVYINIIIDCRDRPCTFTRASEMRVSEIFESQ